MTPERIAELRALLESDRHDDGTFHGAADYWPPAMVEPLLDEVERLREALGGLVRATRVESWHANVRVLPCGCWSCKAYRAALAALKGGEQ